VVGQVPLTGGELELFGTPQRRFRDWARIGYVPQRTTAASGVPATVREVVSAGRLARTKLRLPRKADRRAVERAIELVGMADRAGDSVDALSGGQHQRVLIARALASEPELLIMDEPMAGVDLASQEVLAGTLREQVGAGAAVLLVLHELGPLEPLIDRAVVLRDGCVVHDGPPPQGLGQHALPGHDHVHPHADAAAHPIRTGLLT
jgi:zinc transport system ATP-binding protein